MFDGQLDIDQVRRLLLLLGTQECSVDDVTYDLAHIRQLTNDRLES